MSVIYQNQKGIPSILLEKRSCYAMQRKPINSMKNEINVNYI